MAHVQNLGRIDEGDGDTGLSGDPLRRRQGAATNETVDWIEGFLECTKNFPSPEIFRLWAAISAVAGALERRVWLDSAEMPIYPNLYVLLVATPGIGKNVIQTISNIWMDARKFKTAPHSPTKASLVDALADASTSLMHGDPPTLIEYHSLLVAAPEFGVLISKHDLEFLSVLNFIYDNPPHYSERRRTVNEGKELVIVHPQLTILAGVQPGFLATTLPEEAWSMGTTSRLIMIHASERVKIKPKLKTVSGENTGRKKTELHLCKLVEQLAKLQALHGEFTWDHDAKESAETWLHSDCIPIPIHSKLTHYIPRRWVHCMKLCMVASASRSTDMRITLADFDRARDWLLAAEIKMPDIFREMYQKSDKELLQDLHLGCWARYSKTKTAIDESEIYGFLSGKCTVEKIKWIIEAAERSKLIERMAGTKTWKPLVQQKTGIE